MNPLTVCATCGKELQWSFGGWGHIRKPDRPHVVKPIKAAEETE